MKLIGKVRYIFVRCDKLHGEPKSKRFFSLGINTILMTSGWITTSSARMNDHFFIEGSDENKRQYTMCHEVRLKITLEFGMRKPCSQIFELCPLTLQNRSGTALGKKIRVNGFGAPTKRNYLLTLCILLFYRLPHTDEAFWNRDLGNCKSVTSLK